MKYLVNYILLCLMLFAYSNSFAIETRAQFTYLINNMHSLTAKFILTVYDNKGQAIQQSFGKIALVRPGRFRFEVLRPIPQLIIANQSRLWIYDEDLAQVTIRSLKKISTETPGLLLSHSANHFGKDFIIKSLSSRFSTSEQSFLLIPKMNDNMFSSVILNFKAGIIHDMEFKDHLGHRTHILFKDVKLNNSLPNSLFVFLPSSNIDVIDETKK